MNVQYHDVATAVATLSPSLRLCRQREHSDLPCSETVGISESEAVMNLSEPSSGMYRDPDEQQLIVAEMTALIEHDPTNAQAYFRRGNALSNLRQYAPARHDLDRVIALEPDNAMAYNNRGIAFLCTGDTEAAIDDLCRAIALDPAYRDAYHNRGLAYSEVDKLEEAIADLTHAIALDPAFWSAYRHRSIVHAMRGDHDASFRDYLKTRELEGGQ